MIHATIDLDKEHLIKYFASLIRCVYCTCIYQYNTKQIPCILYILVATYKNCLQSILYTGLVHLGYILPPFVFNTKGKLAYLKCKPNQTDP